MGRPPGELCTLTTPDVNHTCTRFYTPGETVVLTAIAAPGSVFTGWIHPACPATAGPCTVTVNESLYVEARFFGAPAPAPSARVRRKPAP